MKTKILAFTVSYGNRDFLLKTVQQHRARAGIWFDWLVCLGAPSLSLHEQAKALLNHPERLGIQHLLIWPENRGQHHAMKAALDLARKEDYDWLLRIDDDTLPRTKGWLNTMLERLEELKSLSGDHHYRLVAAPRIIGLRNRLEPKGTVNLGQSFPVEVMDIVGGACRLHPVSLLENYEAPLLDPLGRGDPQAMAAYLLKHGVGAMIVRFPDIRMNHPTDELEEKDTPEQAHLRRMGHYWPYLPATEAP